MSQERTIVVLAKRPEPGRVKTRLSPAVAPESAAELAAAALHDTLTVVSAARATSTVLSFAGRETEWLRPGWVHHVQPSGGLDVRIAAALGAARSPVLLVGMDTPQLDVALINSFDPARYDACLGPATDGGYWAIGLRDPALAAAAVLDVPMSVPCTYAVQHERLRALGLRVQVLAQLTDVDSIEDAWAVAVRAPHTEFARAVARLCPAAAA